MASSIMSVEPSVVKNLHYYNSTIVYDLYSKQASLIIMHVISPLSQLQMSKFSITSFHPHTASFICQLHVCT
jgi:histidyl-tRNA synthetase